MKVKELVAELLKCNQEAEVCVSTGNGNGCDSCGYGESYSEHEISRCNNLDTRVVLDFD